jgi:hypothetical protein
MFDSYSIRPDQSIKINAVTGAILKNHPKSWFERFHLNSQRANRLLNEGGDKATKKVYNDDAWNSNGRTVRDPENDIIVLQMVICGDMEVMAELIYRKDYEDAKGGE